MAPSDEQGAPAPIALARPAEVAAAGRLSDLLRAAEASEEELPALVRRRARVGLRVVYLSAPVVLGAAEAALLDQAERLADTGAEVTVLWRGRATTAGATRRARVVEVPFGGAFCDVLPPCDLVVAGCWDLVLPARRLGVAPVALLEQGDLAELGEVPGNLARLVARSLAAAAAIWCADVSGRQQLLERYRAPAAAPPDGARGLRAACEGIVDDLPVAAGGERGTLLVDDLPLPAGVLDQLRARLALCPSSELVAPVSQPAVGPFRVVRWRVVGERPDGRPGTTRLWAPLRSEIPVRDAWHQGALELLRANRPERAFRRYAAACESGSQAEQAVLGRWLVISLLAAGRPSAAAELAGAFAGDFPTHPDYLYLAVVAAQATGQPVDLVAPAEALRLLGEGSQYDEWFADPYGLLVDHVRSGWPGLAGGSGPGGTPGRVHARPTSRR